MLRWGLLITTSPYDFMKTVNLRITGRVQGVYYRAWTCETALPLKLNGWVRNRADGSVEALVSGDAGAVDQLIEKCWQGSHASKVHDIIVTDSIESVQDGFAQKPTV